MNYGKSPRIGQLWKIMMELYISMDMYNVYKLTRNAYNYDKYGK